MRYRSTYILAIITVTLSVAMVVFFWVSHGFDVAGHLTEPGWAGSASDPDSASRIVLFAGLLIGLGLAGTLALPAGVIFLVWVGMAAHNLRVLGVQGMRFGVGWTVGWWFVPFANLVLPFLALKEVYLGSEPGVAEFDRKRSLTPGVLAGFWVCWILFTVLSSIDLRAVFPGDAAVANLSIGCLTAAYLAQAVGVWCFSVLVLRISRWQDDKHKRGGAGLYVCPSCGYDLRGTRGPLCPECGAVIPDAIRTAVQQRMDRTSGEPWQT